MSNSTSPQVLYPIEFKDLLYKPLEPFYNSTETSQTPIEPCLNEHNNFLKPLTSPESATAFATRRGRCFLRDAQQRHWGQALKYFRKVACTRTLHFRYVPLCLQYLCHIYMYIFAHRYGTCVCVIIISLSLSLTLSFCANVYVYKLVFVVLYGKVRSHLFAILCYNML